MENVRNPCLHRLLRLVVDFVCATKRPSLFGIVLPDPAAWQDVWIFVDQRVWQHVKVGRVPAGNGHGPMDESADSEVSHLIERRSAKFPNIKIIALGDIEREDGRDNAMALGVRFLRKGAMLMIAFRLCNLG